MIYRPIRTLEDFTMLQGDIDSLTLWTEQNFLRFHADKCKYMVISRKHQINPSLESQPPLQINGVTMERVDNYCIAGNFRNVQIFATHNQNAKIRIAKYKTAKIWTRELLKIFTPCNLCTSLARSDVWRWHYSAISNRQTTSYLSHGTSFVLC